MREGPLAAALAGQEAAWRARPVVRRLYRSWYELVRRSLASVPGPVVELGCGIGKLKEVIPEAVATDVEATPWTDEVVDAVALPYADASIANLVLVDVFHHLGRPRTFLREAARVLAPGGRVVILDPYCSPLSTIAYRLFHHERTDLSAAPFADDEEIEAGPLASNQARATLAFFRHRAELARAFPELALLRARRLAVLVYPLSGGFSGPSLVPARLYAPLAAAERVLQPILAPIAAFRCLVVLERR